MPGREYAAGLGSDYRFGFNGKEKDSKGEWGELNHYDYGFRIYNPAIGRFLSVDPLTKDYPWYTPYQFAGSTPIQAIDLDGLEEKKIVGNLYELSVDMRNVPKAYHSNSGRIVKTSYNLHGYGRNNLYFWEEFIKKYPDALDEWNKGRVLVEGRSPQVTSELKKRFQNRGINVDHWKAREVINHHHVNQKSQAVPLSRSEHRKIPTIDAKALAKKLGRTSNTIGNLGGLAGWLNGNPDSWLSWFDNSIRLGNIKKEPQSGLYFTVVSLNKTSSYGEAYFNIYDSYEWDNELNKYIGVNQVGYGYKYEENGGYSEERIYDLDGNITKIEEKGSRTSPRG